MRNIDEKIESKVKVLVVPLLLAVITGLLGFYGTRSIAILDRMEEKIENLVIKTVEQGKDIEALKSTDQRHEASLSEMLRAYARKEEIFELHPTTTRP